MTAVRVLSVCTHNRTRSVLMGGFLTGHLDDLAIDGAVRVVGFIDAGQPATAETVRILARRGLDVTGHRSRVLTDDDVTRADLVITAERMHVIEIAGRWPLAFGKTMTLPEVVARGDQLAETAGGDLPGWLERLSTGRPERLDYLDADDIGEIPDPTGHSPATWRGCSTRIDELTQRLARLLA